MTYEQFENSIVSCYKYANNKEEIMLISGVISKVIRLCISNPELAKAYWEGKPKAIMDNMDTAIQVADDIILKIERNELKVEYEQK